MVAIESILANHVPLGQIHACRERVVGIGRGRGAIGLFFPRAAVMVATINKKCLDAILLAIEYTRTTRCITRVAGIIVGHLVVIARSSGIELVDFVVDKCSLVNGPRSETRIEPCTGEVACAVIKSTRTNVSNGVGPPPHVVIGDSATGSIRIDGAILEGVRAHANHRVSLAVVGIGHGGRQGSC